MSARALPLTLKMPLVVAALMIVVAVGISKIVLDRLSATQNRHIEQLTGAYLDGLSTALLPALMRRDAWEAFDALDRARQRYSGVRTLDVLAILPDGSVLAAADPVAHPVLSPAPPAAEPPARQGATLDAGDEAAWIHREMLSDGVRIGRIAALIDLSAYRNERREAQVALLVVNAALTLILAVLGYFFVRRMLAPAALLTASFAAAAAGRPETIAEHRLPPAGTEGGQLLRGYNRMLAALDERETLRRRLAEEARAALLGRLASSLAHEVNNPLGGLFNAVAMIRRHGDDPERRERAASLLERGLGSIRDIVRASLVLWKSGESDADLIQADLDDLRFLAQAEIDARGLTLDWAAGIGARAVPVAARDVRQVALNLLLNACAASPPGGRVRFEAIASADRLEIEIADEGPGLPADARARLLDGDAAAPAGGLGLWTVARILRSAQGRAEVSALADRGARVRAVFPFPAREAAHAKSAA
jgi:signal transduction histidine kinase